MHEKHKIIVFVETIRKWMIADGLWVPYVRRKPRIYQPRSHRDCLGELIQLEDSHLIDLKVEPQNVAYWCLLMMLLDA